MNEKHTSGPWQAITTPFQEGFTVQAQPHPAMRGFTRTIAYVGNEATDENRANAALISAAPEMLEALKRCEAMVSTADGPPNWDWVREVISKAQVQS